MLPTEVTKLTKNTPYTQMMLEYAKKHDELLPLACTLASFPWQECINYYHKIHQRWKHTFSVIEGDNSLTSDYSVVSYLLYILELKQNKKHADYCIELAISGLTKPIMDLFEKNLTTLCSDFGILIPKSDKVQSIINDVWSSINKLAAIMDMENLAYCTDSDMHNILSKEAMAPHNGYLYSDISYYYGTNQPAQLYSYRIKHDNVIFFITSIDPKALFNVLYEVTPNLTTVNDEHICYTMTNKKNIKKSYMVNGLVIFKSEHSEPLTKKEIEERNAVYARAKEINEYIKHINSLPCKSIQRYSVRPYDMVVDIQLINFKEYSFSLFNINVLEKIKQLIEQEQSFLLKGKLKELKDFLKTAKRDIGYDSYTVLITKMIISKDGNAQEASFDLINKVYGEISEAYQAACDKLKEEYETRLQNIGLSFLYMEEINEIYNCVHVAKQDLFKEMTEYGKVLKDAETNLKTIQF